jgi:glycine/D-amino acid oxidase-like deaminating enzyme/nitrite reductase/ring-hydroxylating ferredoxin subunit
MNASSGRSASIWSASADLPSRPGLQANADTDVCIVGAGIAGLTTAYLLARTRRVIVLDDGPIAGGETGRTTAHIASALDDRYFDLEKLHGEDGARLAAESHTAAITQIEEIVRKEDIDCGFERVDGYLFAPPGGDPGEFDKILEKELAAVQRAGLTDVRRVDRVPIPLLPKGPALLFPRQAQFHPVRYVAGLVEAIERRGGVVRCGTHVKRVDGGNLARIETSDGYVVTAGAVVVATNSPVIDRVAIHTKQAAYRTYVIAARIEPHAVPRALYWDLCQEAQGSECPPRSPYHYVRLSSRVNPTHLIVGAEDHKTGQSGSAAERFTRLEEWTRQRFPIQEIRYRWSGQVLEPVDSLAFIGRNPMDADNVYIATGDSGNGMTHGTIAGMLLRDLIEKRANPWENLYSPSRLSFSGGAEFLKQNLNVAAQYADWVKPATFENAEQLKWGEGGIVRWGLAKLACYRDEAGNLHERSAVCVHLGCLVRWNAFERSWDCPCHGSRFDTEGRVVNGPANKDLEPASVPVSVGARNES